MRSVFLAFWLSGLLTGCSNSPTEQPIADKTTEPALTPAEADISKVKAAEASFRAEPKVIDLVYDPKAAVQWTIGVKDDGGSRLGYADYFCVRLQQLGIDTAGTNVRIVDYRKYMAPGGNGRDANLGTVHCATDQPLS